MNRVKILIWAVLIGCFCILSIGLQSCSEFFTKDITESALIINSPTDSLYSSSNEITFWWDEDAAIESFRLQVVRPGFDNPTSIFDTLFQGSILSLFTEEGRYEWHIRGENEGSVSAYQTRSFVIDQTAPEKPQVLFPIDTLNTNEDQQMLSWISKDAPIDGAQFPVSDSMYLFEKDSQSLLQTYFIENNAPKTVNLEHLALSKNAAYQWLIVSFDQAGHITRSDTSQFWLK